MNNEGEPTPGQYFPEGIFDEKPELDRFCSDCYALTLTAFEEPSLWRLSKRENLHAYRFIWIPSSEIETAWAAAAVVVRLAIDANGAGSLAAKVGRETGAKVRSVSREETAAFLSVVASTTFWELPTKSERLGLDGAQWITEGTRNGMYHVVDRWSPEKGSYRELGLHFLVKLARLQYEQIP